jgi:hypothetical protein
MMADSVNQILSGLEAGLVSQADIENLNKAITAGYGGAGKPTDLTYGGVLQAESLEATLKSVTFDMKNLKMWPAVSVDKAYNLFEQYNRLHHTLVKAERRSKKIRRTFVTDKRSCSSVHVVKSLTR